MTLDLQMLQRKTRPCLTLTGMCFKGVPKEHERQGPSCLANRQGAVAAPEAVVKAATNAAVSAQQHTARSTQHTQHTTHNTRHTAQSTAQHTAQHSTPHRLPEPATKCVHTLNLRAFQPCCEHRCRHSPLRCESSCDGATLTALVHDIVRPSFHVV